MYDKVNYQSKQKICKYYNTPNGCYLNNNCKFIHQKLYFSYENKIPNNKYKKNEYNINTHSNFNNPQKNSIKNIKCVRIYNEEEKISYISLFPSGNLICVTFNKSIKIYDNDFILQNIIRNAHQNPITLVNIKDEENFVTSSWEGNIKFWKKEKKNKYEIKQKINKAHNGNINTIIYYSNEILISSSDDGIIKIWELNKFKKYNSILVLNHSAKLFSILLLNDLHILLSSGHFGIKIWNINNYECIINLKGRFYYDCNIMKRINKDNVILNGMEKLLKIFSISEKQIIKLIDLSFDCFCIHIVEEKGIFLIGGNSNNILIFRNDDYKFIYKIKNANEKWLELFIGLKEDLFLTYWSDQTIKIWSF